MINIKKIIKHNDMNKMTKIMILLNFFTTYKWQNRWLAHFKDKEVIRISFFT